ncbi:acyltransferase family protein [Rothia nasimurium]|uniref:acyltransferase family protein n=1 Tax=Rothia nasimurium TaxID=85336 RepID=UPI001F374FC8|nr:acyltransferase family protein [Rothia nasimurium]
MSRPTRRHKPLGSFLEQPTFRPEVQGLRSLAVLLVVMYHVWFGKVSGGVDVFLFISAFLLSLSSLKKIKAGHPLKVVGYWLHVFQRLLPAAATVVALTLVAAYFVLPPSRWGGAIDDAWASLFYYQNWHLAFGAVDYYAQDATTKTPFQHFWSLSMQGQIFVLWPLLFTLVSFLVGYLRFKVLPTALMVFGSVFVASLTFSILETSTNQAFAYFDTRTRLWEFAAGTLLAMLVLAWRVPQALKVPLGWLGIIGLVSCGWLLPVEQAFPGYLALWPLLSAALIIAAGQTGSAFGVDRLLSAAPLQKMGAISYCLYLVHWPLLILYTTATNKPQAGWPDGTLIILASIAGAWVLHNLVEKPLRAWEKKPSRSVLTPTTPWAQAKDAARATWVRPATVIAACLLLIGGGIYGTGTWLNAKITAWETNTQYAGTDRFPGALAAGENRTYSDLPIPMVADHQRAFLSGSCAVHPGINEPNLDDASNDNYCWATLNTSLSAPLTVIVGDSHAHHNALPIFKQIAEDTNSNIIAIIRPGCRFTFADFQDEACQKHNTEAYEQILDLDPDNVVLISTWTNPRTTQEDFTPGLEPIIEDFTDAGIKVIGVRDNPRWEDNMFDCAQRNIRDATSCGAPVDVKMGPVDESLDILDKYPRTYTLDFTPQLCPNDYCEAIIGNVIVYMDDDHLNKSFVETLVDETYRQLDDQGWSIKPPTTKTSQKPSPSPTSKKS